MTGKGRILIIADDLTGAMDSAGPFAGRGVETWVVADPAACDPSSLKSAHVVSVNTDSRHLSGPVAAERVAEAEMMSVAEQFLAGSEDVAALGAG
ncbi:MAG: four-carbon acid sugar kinase family protein, partial [Burkholderiales bacterium]